MDNLKTWWQTHRPTNRRLVQLYAALLYNANLKGFVDGKLFTGYTKALCVPGLNCYSCPGAIGACPLGALQNALAVSGHTAGWYVFGILLLFGITLGRTVCGWLCPVGLIQELLHKIPTPKIPKSRFTRILSLLKYVILVVFVIAIPLYIGLSRGMPMPAFCKYICPAGTGEGAVMLLGNPANENMFGMLGVLFTRKFVILVAVILASIFCYRSFCRFLCPLGAIYSLFNRFALAGVHVDRSRCNHCGACVRTCEMDVRCVGDRECISCGKCMGSCAKGAIAFTCGGRTIVGPDMAHTGNKAGQSPLTGSEQDQQNKQHVWNGKMIWLAALAFMALVLLCVNVFFAGKGKKPADTSSNGAVYYMSEGQTEAATDALPESSAPIGYEAGCMLDDFTCTLMDGSEFHLADEKGKIVFINQWATYCTPCVAELPAFEQLQEAHPDIVVLACHNWLETRPTARDYIQEQGWAEWKIRFTVDTKDQTVVSRIGGDNTMPRTVVLNKKGEVVYNEQRSVDYEMLEELLKRAEEE